MSITMKICQSHLDDLASLMRKEGSKIYEKRVHNYKFYHMKDEKKSHL